MVADHDRQTFNNAVFYTFSSVRSLFNTVIDGHQDLSSRVRMENERMTGELKNDVKTNWIILTCRPISSVIRC